MKITKNILREIVESEMNLLNEAQQRTGFLNLRSAERTVGKLETLLAKWSGAGISGPRKDRLRQRFMRLWNAIAGGIMLSDLELEEGGDRTPLGTVVDRAIELGLLQSNVTTSTEGGNTATNTEDPDLNRTRDQLQAALAEVEAEEAEEEAAAEEEPEEAEAESASEDSPAQDGGETDLSTESVAMLTTIATQGGVLKSGNRGPKVKLLQDALRTRLGDMSHQWLGGPGKSDSDFAGNTKLAVKALQGKYNITADGVVGRNTAASLLAGEAATGSAPVRRRTAPDDAGTAAESTTPDRPTELGSGFAWDPELEIWWSDMDHSYDGDTYNLWIRKGDDEWHANGSHDDLEISDFESPANESKSLSARLGMILSEAIDLVNHIDGQHEDDTAASDMVGSSPAEDAEEPEDEDESDPETADSTNVGRLEEIVALVGVTTLTSWTEPEFVQSIEDWIINGFSGNDFRNEFSYLSKNFEEKLDRMLNYDFKNGYGGNLSDFEKNDFKEKTGSTSLSTLEPNKLTKQKLTQHLERTETPFDSGRVDDAWNKFVGTQGAISGYASVKTSLKLRKSESDESGADFIYTGHEEFIILLAALKKLRRMKDELSGFSDEPETELQSESLSYDRLGKLAGIL
jgi:hypothetical protein